MDPVETQATLQGTHTKDEASSSWGTKQRIQGTSASSMTQSHRLVDVSQVSVQPLTVTWSGRLVTTTSTIALEPTPKVHVIAKSGAVSQEYWFDAIPGGEWTFVCSSLTVDVAWDIAPQLLFNSNFASGYSPAWPTRNSGSTTGTYEVSASCHEGRGVNRAKLTQYIASGNWSGAAILNASLLVPHWAHEVMYNDNAGFVTSNEAISQGRGLSSEDPTSVTAAVIVHASADLDTFQRYGVQLPIIGDHINWTNPTASANVIWLP
jgi:hypothetical protein